jgi:hypothetical protein
VAYPILIGGAPKAGKGTVIRVEVTRATLQARLIWDEGGNQGIVELSAPKRGWGRFPSLP